MSECEELLECMKGLPQDTPNAMQPLNAYVCFDGDRKRLLVFHTAGGCLIAPVWSLAGDLTPFSD